MDGNTWRANSGQAQVPGQVMGGEAPAAPGMDAADWRTQLQADSRQRIVNKIMDTLKRHLPLSGHDGMQGLKKMAVGFEEETYTGATSQSDYLRKLSLKMLRMETKSEPVPGTLQPNPPSNSRNPQDQDSSSQTGNTIGGDWQEEIFQKIRSMNDMFFPELNDMYQKMAAKLRQPKNEQLEKLKFFKTTLERLIMFLRISKNEIQPSHKDRIGGIEKQIINILNSNRPGKPVSSMQQGQMPQPHLHTMQRSQQPPSQISQMHRHEMK